jgi:D-alanyl-D-alanine carboxypeptidase (penicillin-binding protein 5/6)
LYMLLIALVPTPKPTVQLSIQSGNINTGTAATMPWPRSGNVAIGTTQTGILATRDADQLSPTASTAKIILALAVLRKHPIQPGQTGPIITLTAEDERFYQDELARNGSVVPVTAGMQLTEYQALEALLLASGNNIAATLARWAFGSASAYSTEATAMLRDMGVTKTHLDDVAGFSPATVSTPQELVAIAKEAMKIPVFATIVSQKIATLPIIGSLRNTNSALGLAGINGVKTGHTDESGGCLVFSATRTVDGHAVTVVGALQAASSIEAALALAPDLVEASYQNLTYSTIASPTKQVGTVTTPWSQPIAVIPQKEISLLVWKGSQLQRTVTSEPINNGRVGRLQIGDQTTDLVLASPLAEPSYLWRLTHPLQLLGWSR